MPVTVAELNRIIKRIKDVQKRFGNENMQKGDTDTSFEGRTERCKALLRSSDELIKSLDEEEDADVDKITLVKAKNEIRKNLGQVKGNIMIMKKEYNKQLQKSKKRGMFKSKNLSDTELGEQSRKILGLEQQHSKLVGKYEDKTLGGVKSSSSSTDVGISFDAFIGSSDHTAVEMTGFGNKQSGKGFSSLAPSGGFRGGGSGSSGRGGGSGGGGGDFSAEDGFGDEDLTEFDKQCLATIKDLQEDIDSDLDLIGQGIAFLKEAAETMGEHIDLQAEMLDEVGGEITKAQTDLDNLNDKTKDTLKQQASQNMCIYLICCIVMLGVIMVGYNLISKATGGSQSKD